MKETFSSNMERNFILLIDKILRRNPKAYLSTSEILSSALEAGMLYRQDDVQDPRILQRVKAAKKAVSDNLVQYGLTFDEIQDTRDKRCKLFRYPAAIYEKNLDVVAVYRNTHTKLRKDCLEDLLSQMKGLVPEKLMAELTLHQLRKKDKRKFVEFDGNDLLCNIELIPDFYMAIRDKHVVTFEYQPYGKVARQVVFHPHYLKEYNNRWFVFGTAKQTDGIFYNNFALDRIVDGQIEIHTEIPYEEATIDFSHYFDDIIGVSRRKHAEVITITLRTHDRYTHERIISKPIHVSQSEKKSFDDEEQFGLITLKVRPNLELLGLLLGYGRHITVTDPVEYRDTIQKEIQNMLDTYH